MHATRHHSTHPPGCFAGCFNLLLLLKDMHAPSRPAGPVLQRMRSCSLCSKRACNRTNCICLCTLIDYFPCPIVWIIQEYEQRSDAARRSGRRGRMSQPKVEFPGGTSGTWGTGC